MCRNKKYKICFVYSGINLKIKVMRDVKLENAATESVSKALKGDVTGMDLLNIIKFQNRETEVLSNYDSAILIMYSAAFN
jgi:hypothetical protein